MPDTHVVVRVIHGEGGGTILAWTRVDGFRWANTKKLVGAGQLRELTPADFEEPSEDESVSPVDVTISSGEVAPEGAVNSGETITVGEPGIEPDEPTPLDHLGLDDRVLGLLSEGGFEGVEDVAVATDEDLVAVKGIGKATVKKIRKAVAGK